MITIIKEGNKIRCSQNTYDTMYKRLGYKIFVEAEKKPLVVETKVLEDTKVLKDTEKEKIVTPKINTKARNTRSRAKKGE